MKQQLTRRAVMIGGLSTAGLLVAPGAVFSAEPATRPARPDKGPPIEPAFVRQFVGVGHSDLAAVTQMLAERPGVINGVWDWGGGDFETALGGASHMGRADIAGFLVEQGARLDLFAAAALGKIDVIKAAVAAFPGIHRTPGPHGIPLLAHAKKAGQDEIARFIESLG